MSRVSLQWRVALAAAAAIVLALTLLGVGVQIQLSRELRSSLDDGLRRRAADIARLNASAPGVLTQRLLRPRWTSRWSTVRVGSWPARRRWGRG
jgi:hypothetical protein